LVAAAVALLLVSIQSTPDLFDKVQQSGIFPVSRELNTTNKVTENIPVTESKTDIPDSFIESGKSVNQQVDDSEEIASDELPETTAKEIVADIPSKPAKTYYVIIGGDTNRANANRLLSAAVTKGFKEAGIVSAPERHRIYVASFSDKDEANDYLDSFRKSYPAHGDAWLFTKRN